MSWSLFSCRFLWKRETTISYLHPISAKGESITQPYDRHNMFTYGHCHSATCTSVLSNLIPGSLLPQNYTAHITTAPICHSITATTFAVTYYCHPALLSHITATPHCCHILLPPRIAVTYYCHHICCHILLPPHLLSHITATTFAVTYYCHHIN